MWPEGTLQEEVDICLGGGERCVEGSLKTISGERVGVLKNLKYIIFVGQESLKKTRQCFLEGP